MVANVPGLLGSDAYSYNVDPSLRVGDPNVGNSGLNPFGETFVPGVAGGGHTGGNPKTEIDEVGMIGANKKAGFMVGLGGYGGPQTAIQNGQEVRLGENFIGIG